MGHLLVVANKVAKEKGLDKGYRYEYKVRDIYCQGRIQGDSNGGTCSLSPDFFRQSPPPQKKTFLVINTVKEGKMDKTEIGKIGKIRLIFHFLAYV